MKTFTAEEIAEFVARWDAPARHTGERQTDSPPTPLGESINIITYLQAREKALREAVMFARLVAQTREHADRYDAALGASS